MTQHCFFYFKNDKSVAMNEIETFVFIFRLKVNRNKRDIVEWETKTQ